MKTLRFLATALVAGALATSVQAHNGVEHDGPHVEVQDLTVVGGAGRIDVAGTLAFDSGEFVAFEDPAGDSLAPGQGLDLTGGTISQNASEIVFTISITDLALGDVQPTAQFNWNLGLEHGEWTRLFAWRSHISSGPNEWFFSVATLGDGGFGEQGVPGEFTGSELVWRVPSAALGVKPGTYIEAGDGPITASQGGAGGANASGTADYDEATWSAREPFAICGGVELELRGPNGIDYLTPRLRRDAFDTSFTDLAPGTYELTVYAECGLEFLEDVHTVVVS